jgi:hypothetical protein
MNCYKVDPAWIKFISMIYGVSFLATELFKILIIQSKFK